MKIKNLWPVPEGLGEHGEAFYKRIGPKLVKTQRLDEVDYYSFIALCEAHHLTEIAFSELNRDGMVIDGGRNVLKKHPTYAIYRTTFDNFVKLSVHFGLTPASRGEKFITIEKPTGKEKKNERFFAVG